MKIGIYCTNLLDLKRSAVNAFLKNTSSVVHFIILTMNLFKNTSLVAVLVAILLTDSSNGQDLMGRCGDCWCIYDGEEASCPTDTTGVVESFNGDSSFYNTFQLTNPDASFLKLETADGEECYPFSGSVDPITNYDLSNLPQCAKPTTTDDGVCAYLYEANTTTCNERNYEIVTFPSETAAMEAGAAIQHKGGTCLRIIFS